MLIAAAILAIFMYGSIAPLLGTLMPTFHLDDSQNGAVALANGAGLMIASLSVGPLIDTKGKKFALLIGLSLVCIVLVWLPNSGGAYGAVLTCMAALGFGGGMIVTAANALASDVNQAKRAQVLNFLNLFFGLGGLATPFLAANLLGGNAVTLAYYLAGLAMLTLIVNAITPMPEPIGERGFKASEAGAMLGRPILLVFALFLFLYVACEVGVWNWLQKYLIERGIEATKALNIVSLRFALGLLIGRAVVSRILVKTPALTVTLVCSIAMAVTTYMMLQSSDPTLAGVAVFCAGLAMAPIFPTTLAMVGDAFPHMTATAMGIVITSGWIGLVVSSSIIGGVAKAYSLHTALMLLPVFSVAMVAINLIKRPMWKKAYVSKCNCCTPHSGDSRLGKRGEYSK